jgi:hypothetical protein
VSIGLFLKDLFREMRYVYYAENCSNLCRTDKCIYKSVVFKGN